MMLPSDTVSTVGEVLLELLDLLDVLLEELDELPDEGGGAVLPPLSPSVVLDAATGLVVGVLFARVFITGPMIAGSDILVLVWSEARCTR